MPDQQYDKIQKNYDKWSDSTIAKIEKANVREVVLPLLTNNKEARVLDLACGSGFFTRSFRDWGAKEVLGVDISSAMIAEAQNLDPSDEAISYLVADCSKPTKFTGRPFDIVFGAWFLNYAANGEEMVDFYRNVLLNLNPGGHFVSITPTPTNDPAAHINRECQLRPLPTASGGMYSVVVRDIADGVVVRRRPDPESEKGFESYHLRKHVYEEAARKAGFEGGMKFDAIRVPGDFTRDPEKYGEKHGNGGASAEELETYSKSPFCGFLHVRKSVHGG